MSYNPAQMELGDVCRIEHGGKMTVETLVRRILSGYQMKIAVVPPRKLVIHARKIESYDVSGTVSEEDSEERLYGAVVTLEDKDGKQWNTISNGKGIFRLHVPEGTYTLKTSYMGYAPQSQSVRVTRDCFVRTCLKPLLFEIEEVTVESGKRENELGELTPSNLLAFSGGDLFSQIWFLPGELLPWLARILWLMEEDMMKISYCWMVCRFFIPDISVRFYLCSMEMP